MGTAMCLRNCLAAIILCVIVGCGGDVTGPAFAPVSGVVTLEGKPIDGATIVFTPKKEGTMSMALSDPDGKFVMKSGSGRKGAAVGDHDVTVILSVATEPATQATEDSLAPPLASEMGTDAPKSKPSRVGYIVPERYSKPGALSVTVPSGGLNNYQLELKK